MSIDRFEDVARGLVTAPSRRAVSRALLGLSAGSVLAPLFAITESEAKKKHKHKGKKKKKHPHPPPTQICLAECAAEHCCDAATNQVCKNGAIGNGECLAGGCPATDFCTDPDFYVCWSIVGEISCLCATPIEGGESVCIDPSTAGCGNTCTSSSDCGEGSVCIPYGEGSCACDPPIEAFCAALCDKSQSSRAGRDGGRTANNVVSLKRGG